MSTTSPPMTHRQKLFSYNPAPVPKTSRVPVTSAPLHFLDHHISGSLIIKRVQIVPELHVDLTAALDRFAPSLDSFNDWYFSFPARQFYADRTLAGALALTKARRTSVEVAAVQVASSLLLHPDQPGIVALPMWRDALYDVQSTMINEEYASQNLALHLCKAGDEQIAVLSRKNRELYERLGKHVPQLTSCMCFCMDALPLLEDMTRLESQDIFPWKLHSRCDAPLPVVPSAILDAPDSLWTLPKAETPRRSSRLRQTSTLSVHHKNDIYVEKRDKDGEYTPHCEDYVQKAWATAVKIDASLIVFDCGDFLRFGIRHRQSQTLFLSEVIDVCASTDPSYGRLLTALTVAAVYDAIMRLPLLENNIVLGKRKSDNELPTRRYKKLRTNLNSDAALDEATSKLLESTPALAVSFRFDHLDSPAPLLLFSPEAERKPSYKPSEYLNVTVDKELGAGAVGDVYRATIEPSKAHYQPFVLKIASTRNSIRRLRHEVRVYRHLHEAGVLGIPSLLGFRESAEVDVCVLMLSDAGTPLAYRMDIDKKVELLPKEQHELTSILKGIHVAGVLHRDVRSWNMMQDELGRLRFTDFDRASLHATESHYLAEKERLEEFVGGAFIDKARVIGVDDV